MIAARMIARAAGPRAMAVSQQQRGILTWLTNYPDTIKEQRAIQCKGGTLLGADNPTWTKQPGDKVTNYIGMFLVATGLAQLISGHYKLATGKGKME